MALHAVLEKSGEQLSLQIPDVAKLGIEDEQLDTKVGAPFRYGVVQQVRLNLAAKSGVGRWQELSGGLLEWRLDIKAKGATSLEFGFSHFRLPHGAMLTIRSADGSQKLAPLTDANNPTSGVPLYTAMLQTDAAVLELILPADKRESLRLEMSSASYGYRDPLLETRTKSGSCNIDTACPEGDEWQSQIASVAGYTFQSNASSLYCTGTLMNTGDPIMDSTRPRFSTAHHCVSTAQAAEAMVFYWGYESRNCRAVGSVENGTQLPIYSNIRFIQTGGARLLATDATTDFTAVELNTPIPEAAQVYYSGWDRRDISPQGSVGIHHPAGHEKRISFNDDPLTVRNNCIPGVWPDQTTHWQVNDWEVGTTEGGSSGSGLWNPANGLLIGILSGGRAACSIPEGFDCYGRLSAAWEATSSTGSTIRAAFDRSGTNPQTMPGKGTCDAPAVTLTSSAFNSAPRAGERFHISANVSGGAGGYSYHWDLDGDGVFEREGSDQVEVSFPTRRSGNMQLRVVDSAGCATTVSRALDIAAPVIEVVSVGSPVEECGNDNGGIDKGERFRLPVTLRNSGNVALPAGARALFAPSGGANLDLGPNQFGYVGSSDCGYEFIDLAQGEHAVDALETHVANGNGYGPLDDARTQTITLGGQGIHLYGQRYAQAVMSTNGYVSFDPEDDGGAGSINGDELSCDGGLAEGSGGPQLRPFHDDLRILDKSGAGLRYQYFQQCPRASQVGGIKACHVFQWTGMETFGLSVFHGDAEFQAVVYEDTGEIVYQYKTRADVDESFSVIGLVNATGGDALRMACPLETGIVPASQTAICAYSPSALPSQQAAFRLETPTVLFDKELAPGASTTVNLPLAIRSDAACGAPLKLDYIATAASGSHSVQSSSHNIGSVHNNCQTVSSCSVPIAEIDTRDGNYYNPQRSGNGFNNYPFGGVWYTANADHTPAWYNIVGEYQDNLLRTPILHVTNQATLPAISTQIRNAGNAHVARIDATNLMFAWRMDNGSSGAELLRLTSDGVARAGNDHTQHWYPPSQSGWGLDVESLRLGGADKDIMLIYLYDTAGNPRWVTGDGPLDSHRPHCPGCPYYPDWNARKQSAGNAVLDWDGAAKGRINTTITLPQPLQGTWNRSNVPVIPIGEVRP